MGSKIEEQLIKVGVPRTSVCGNYQSDCASLVDRLPLDSQIRIYYRRLYYWAQIEHTYKDARTAHGKMAYEHAHNKRSEQEDIISWLELRLTEEELKKYECLG